MRNRRNEKQKVGTSKFYRITIFLVAFLNTVVLPRLPYLPNVSLLSISFNFFNRWFSISAMRSWCSNCAILICACSHSVRGSCSYLRLPRRSYIRPHPIPCISAFMCEPAGSLRHTPWLSLRSCSQLQGIPWQSECAPLVWPCVYFSCGCLLTFS